jgi:branched-chain amino acid transport system substrate-binding protein
MKKTILTIMLVISLFLISCGQETSEGTTTETIEQTDEGAKSYKIGVLFATTGDVAVYGLPMLEAVQLAAEQAKASDVNVELVVEDSRCEPQTAATAMQKLATVDKVDAVIGEICSSATLAAAPIAEENKILMVSPSATSPDIATAGDYIFRVVTSDSFQGKVGAQLAIQKGYTTAAVLYINNDYGAGLNKVFTSEYEASGGDVVYSDAFEQSSTDFRTLLTKVKEAAPDVIYFVGLPVECGNAFKQKAELGVQTEVIAAEGCKDDSVIELAGSGAEGVVVTTPAPNTDAVNQAFSAAYKARTGEDPKIYTAESYDAFNVVLWALQTSDGTKEAAKDTLYTLQNYAGAAGPISFDSQGEVEKPYTSWTITDGVFVEN